MRMGIIAKRQRQRRAAQARKHTAQFAAAIGLLACLTSAPLIADRAERLAGIQAFSQSDQQEITLPEYEVYALQLAVFDSGERAAAELKRLQQAGVRGIIWQGKQMRIVADAAFSREALNLNAAKGQEAYVIRDTLEMVSVRLSADALSIAKAKDLLQAPDEALNALVRREQTLEDIVTRIKPLAEEAIHTHPENALYTQLAQSLLDWSMLMEKTLEETDDAAAGSYAAVTLCTLCRELRQALSMLSTASAQRTPSTAADVMPPA